MYHLTQDNSNRATIRRTENELLRLARNLCEYGRFLEEKDRCIEREEQELVRKARLLQEVLFKTSALLQNAGTDLGQQPSAVGHLTESLSEICQPRKSLKKSEDNVHHMFAYRTDHNRQSVASRLTNEETDTMLQQASTHMMYQQMRYVLVYLGRAIETRESACLPRLADDVRTLSICIYSQPMQTLAAELVRAAALENWNSIQLLHQALSEELDNKTRCCESPGTLRAS